MRFVYFFLFVILVSSCAHNRIRYSRVDKSDVQIVQQISEKKKAPYTGLNLQKHVSNELEYKYEVSETKSLEISEESTSEINTLFDSPENAAESTPNRLENIGPNEDEPSSEMISATALKAENDAHRAYILFITTLALLFIPFTTLFSFIPFIFGTIKLARSSSSRYITMEGERKARIARILQVIYISLIVIVALIILAFFLLL